MVDRGKLKLYTLSGFWKCGFVLYLTEIFSAPYRNIDVVNLCCLFHTRRELKDFMNMCLKLNLSGPSKIITILYLTLCCSSSVHCVKRDRYHKFITFPNIYYFCQFPQLRLNAELAARVN